MKRLYRLMMLAAGTRRAEFVSALKASVIGSFAQAAAYAMLIGLLHELATPEVESVIAWRWFVAFVACYLLEAAMRLRELRFQYAEWATVMSDVRLELGDRLRSMPLQQLEKRAAGDLSAVVGGNVAYATMGVSQFAFLFLQALIVPVVLVAVVLVVDWRIGLVLLIALPAAIPFIRAIQRRGGLSFRAVNQADADTSSRIVEYVQGMPVLRATGQTGQSAQRLDAALRHQAEALRKGQKSLTMPSIVATTAMQLDVVAAVGLGAWLVFDDRQAAALVAALTLAAVKLAEPLANATSLVSVFELSEASIERIGEVMDTRPLPVRGDGARIVGYDIVFDNVTYGYETSHAPVLDRVSFTVPPRSLTALVGPSGSGKSTIAKLVTRYDDPSSGGIRVGGIDLREVDPAEIYRYVAVVFQDVYLFDDTIRANIAMARPGATDPEVAAAATAANVDGFVSRLPRGYDTRIGELGGQLSGGERQRVSIARAILKDAPIVLLDEPTAALDSHSEVAVQRAVDALVADKTVLVIAHRLSTVVAADQILVLDGGRIAERGTHADLLAEPGRYATMWHAQTRARHWRVAASTSF